MSDTPDTVESLRAVLKERTAFMTAQYIDLCKACDTLRTQLTAANKDAERLDWIERERPVVSIGDPGRACVVKPIGGEWGHAFGCSTFRAAIDEARKAE